MQYMVACSVKFCFAGKKGMRTRSEAVISPEERDLTLFLKAASSSPTNPLPSGGLRQESLVHSELQGLVPELENIGGCHTQTDIIYAYLPTRQPAPSIYQVPFP